jgi:hypothetical protein
VASGGAVRDIRPALTAWLATASPSDPAAGPAVERALAALERTRYGSAPDETGDGGDRRALLAALRDRHATARSLHIVPRGILPPLNPA